MADPRSSAMSRPSHEALGAESPHDSRPNTAISGHAPWKPLSQVQEPTSPSDVSSDTNIDVEKQDKDIEKQQPPPQTPAGPPGKPQEPQDPNFVTWDGVNDPENPMNWTVKKKWMATMVLSLLTFTITFSSSVFSTGTRQVSEHFHISPEVTTLGTSLFLCGFTVGPSVWGPFSEVFGRMIPLFGAFVVFAIFQIPVAVAQNVETVMLGRFFQGFFGCAPLAIVGGAFTDFWSPVDRGVAIALFAGATFIGPVAGPIVGGFIVQSHLGWRWTQYITLIMAVFFFSIAVLIVPETYGPVLLQRRAKKLRHETKNWALHSQLDTIRVRPSDIFAKYILKPVKMLFLEPILLLITIYISLVYGIIYLFFEAYPVCFQELRGWSPGLGALPFLAITIGVVIGAGLIIHHTKTRYAKKLAANGGKPVPEERLPPMIVGGALLPIGLFWFAWTSSPHITWVPQVLAGIPIGTGVFMIFMQGINYIIDCYLMNANSGIAANTIMRSLAGAGFPLFAVQMYHNLGVQWASSLLAFLCVAMVPVPVVFYIYGAKIRRWSKFSPSL